MEYAPLGIADKKTLRYIFASVRAVKEKATRTFSARSDWIASVISQLGFPCLNLAYFHFLRYLPAIPR